MSPLEADECSENLACGYDPCRTPAFATPVLGAHLVPVGNSSDGQLPGDRDTTYWHEGLSGAFSMSHPQWLSLDAANGWIFTAARFGLEIWDATGSKAANPQRTVQLGRTSFPVWPTDPHEFWPVQDVAVPPGNDAVAAVAVQRGGLAVFATSSKSDPTGKYGDREKAPRGVHAAHINGTDYVFTATQGQGLLAHNLSAAAALGGSGACLDTSPSQINCPGVYVGRLGDKGSFTFVGGTGNADGSRHWVVGSTAGSLQGLEIWEVSNPGSPALRLSGLSGSPVVLGVDLWRNGSKYFLATRMNTGQARIYDVSCIAAGGSCSLGTPLWTRDLTKSGNVYYVTHSASGGRHFVHFGTEHTCTTTPAPQSEWLFDVTSPASPFDMTEVGGAPSNYWPWYYRNTATGFNGIAPRRGRVFGDYFYRTSVTVFDVHQLVNANPTITVSGPATGYAGESLGFSASASGGCTPTEGGWSWTASPDGDTGGSTGSTADVTWTTLGSKSVSASNSGCPGADEVPAPIEILDPTPAVGSVSASPTSVFECQPVTLTALDVTGQEPLSFDWSLTPPEDPDFPSGSEQIVWNVPQGIPPDTYTAEVIVSGVGSSDPKSTTVEVASLPDLPSSFTPLCTNCDDGSPPSPPFGTVHLDANATGATEWNWDFGDGDGFTGWTHDPIAGPNPSHTYATTGPYTIRVQVRNCKEGPVTSNDLVVEIEQVSPLVAGFEPQCGGFGCFLSTGETLTFLDQTEGCDGGDCSWRYAYTNTSSTSCSGYGSPQGPPPGDPPSTSFTYTVANTYYPCVEVTRGAEVAEYRYPSGVEVTPATPPSITVSGPSSGQVGQALSFSASASNCTPASNSWSWTATGVSVASNSSSATISFPSAGSKIVAATNSACGSAQGSKSVSITSSDGGGGGGGTCGAQGTGGLRACFSFSPTSPSPGESVSFDARSSAGSPTGYGWKFGDGSEGSGAQPQHPFASAGSYQVELTVTKPGDSCSFGLCSATHTRTVKVEGGPAPLQASFTSDASCFSQLCTVEVGQEVGFSDTSTGEVTKRTWDFGDGTTADEGNPSHSWSQPDSYLVKLTVENGEASSSTSLTFLVEGDPVAALRSMVVPWISQSDADKALPQSSDLVIHNPGEASLKVKVTFRKRGLPEPAPPTVELTIEPHATHHEADIVKDLFNRPNLSGFLFVEPLEGDAEPVVSSVNRTFQADGRIFGQVVPGFPVDELPAATAGGPQVFHLVGLNANTDRLAYFGISNPSDRPLFYHLRFYDSLGELIGGTEEPEAISRFGQKQYQSEELVKRFGVEHIDDYRIEIEPVEGSPRPYVYGANLRLASKDPSFLRVGRIDASEVFLLGVLSTPGLNESLFRSDLVLGNTSSATTLCDLTFTPTGFQAEPTVPVSESLPGRESLRMEDVVSQWDLGATVGVLRVACDNPSDVFPVVQGESYDVSRPEELYGQFMPALTLEDAAREGGRHVLAGLRQDAGNRTTLWLFNPGDETARYSVRYLDLQGNDLGVESDLPLGVGKFRQINPGHHPFVEESGPISGPGGFVVVVEVATGRVLSAAQVVNAANDPAYIVGQ